MATAYTVTAARQAITTEDPRDIELFAKTVQRLIERYPAIAAELMFSPWMKDRCAKADAIAAERPEDVARPRGATTQDMLNHYSDRAESLATRIIGGE